MSQNQSSSSSNRRGEFEARIAETLEKRSIPFMRQVGIGGVYVDFLVESPDGRLLVLEARRWRPTERNINRAIHQMQLYRTEIGANAALFVFEGLEHSRLTEGVVSEGQLEDAIGLFLRHGALLPSGSDAFSFNELHGVARLKPRVLSDREVPERTIFAAMPFAPHYDDVYLVAMSYAADSVGAACRRVDHEHYQGDVVDEIKALIKRSVAVISDLSESKPNVLYETGFAHALDLPTVHLCSTDLKDLPFDVRNWNTIEYSMGQTFKIRDLLAKRLAFLLGYQVTQ